ncbi:MAG: HAD family hydrolase [Gemmatimonadaceae bacterium]
MPEPRSRTAALLDRDGTIMVDRIYTSNPDDVELLPGAAEALRALAKAGYPAIVITNQSGIARGMISLSQYRAVRRRLDELLAAEGAVIVDSFACPHAPEIHGPCDCRKPNSALYERAGAMYDLDLSRCIYVGDRARDIASGIRFGGRTAFVRSTTTTADDLSYVAEASVPVVDSLLDAVSLLLGKAE